MNGGDGWMEKLNSMNVELMKGVFQIKKLKKLDE